MYVDRSSPTSLYKQKQWLHILSYSEELITVIIPSTASIGVQWTYFLSYMVSTNFRIPRQNRSNKPKLTDEYH